MEHAEGRVAFDSDRALFDVPPEIAYFNTASLSPHLHAVREAGEAALRKRGRPWTISAEDWFTDVERLRELFACVVGATADGVALVPATSYGFAVAARTLGVGPADRVLVLAEEYPSGVYTWRATGAQMVTVERGADRSWTQAVLEVLDERISVVSVPNVHWTDGAVIDLAAVADRSHAVGARLVIDGSQSVGAMPLDVAALRPDFVVSVGYKWLLGPFGIGYLYVSGEHRDGEPIEQNWINRAGSQDFARLVDYRDDYQPGARRFDVGQRTKFELVPMAVAALEQITAWGVATVAERLAVVTEATAQRTVQLGLDPAPAGQRGPHLLGVTIPDDLRDTILPALAAADCYAAVRGRALRIAPHLHVTEDDVDRLIQALHKATTTRR
jgi:selenocysteine lyase/cysteine desulfurase